MAVTLGIHIGHDSSCAIVADGVLVAAVCQERVTRRKHDGQDGLSNRLPLEACLSAAQVSLADIDLIVSSFQAASPGGVGLHRPIVEPTFALFDPSDPRHIVISHHYAHAMSALGSSGLSRAAILVCDLAGSSTYDGKDFLVPFDEFASMLASQASTASLSTEWLSVYEADDSDLNLRHREYVPAHNTPDVFVWSPASLFDNVARFVFRRENAHGQLMALASMAASGQSGPAVAAADMVAVTPGGGVRFHNNWQQKVRWSKDPLDHANLAMAGQRACEYALLHYCQMTRDLTAARDLVAAGGSFLNILTNSAIHDSSLFDTYFVPSAPHDAGISVGCAYAGSRLLNEGIHPGRVPDRLGPLYEDHRIDDAIEQAAHRAVAGPIPTPFDLAQVLHIGKIVARWNGRSEFGPRALGGRSLLASPLLSESKERLNAIKGRQSWRPVAPMVPRDEVTSFFSGPPDSPYMNFGHTVLEPFREPLAAIRHPDSSARVQTLDETDDPYLYSVLKAFGRITGFPVLVNTSLNGPGEPLVETPTDALSFFLAHPDVDLLMMDDRLIRRLERPSTLAVRMAHDTVVSIIHPDQGRRILLIRDGSSMEIREDTFTLINREYTDGWDTSNLRLSQPSEVIAELEEALTRGFVEPSAAGG